jgi:alkaline phosphatase D
MMMLSLILSMPPGPTHEPVDGNTTLVDMVAFGSCAKQHLPQPIWDALIREAPDVFLFIGDAIYGDTTDPSVMEAKFGQLAQQPGYRRLAKACPVLATWDDHDYGLNDGGADFPSRVAFQQLFQDFFGVPADDSRRKRSGVYHSVILGPPGRRVQCLMLDTRYFRSALIKGSRQGLHPDGRPGRYLPNVGPQATMLGSEQWAWLEAQLRQPAELRIIASSIQLVSEDHGFEKWMNLPAERERFCKLLQKTQANGVIVISGDRHKAELSGLAGCCDYTVWDLTSSGLNQQSLWYNEINSHRVGTEYRKENFGTLAIDWQAEDPVVQMRIHGLDGRVVLLHQLTLSELTLQRR